MAVALGPALPLTLADGSTGWNTARDIRYALTGSLLASTGTGVDSVRPGVLPRIWDNSVPAWTDFRVLPKGSPNRFVTVSIGWAVCGRAGQGFWLCHNPVATDIQLPVADGTNPRIDIVWAKVFDKTPASFPADPQHGFYIDYTAGTPAGSPTVPSTPTDAIKLAEIARPALGDTIDASKITDKRKSAGLHGGIRALLPGDASTDAGGYHGEHRLRTGSFVPATYSGLGYTEMVERWSAADSKWHGINPVGMKTAASVFSLVDNIANGDEPTITTTAIADPGYPYRLRISGEFVTLLNPQTALVYRPRDGSTSGTIIFNNGNGYAISRNTEPSTGTGGSAGSNRSLYPSGTSTILTGAKTIYLTAHAEPSNLAALCAVIAGGHVQYEIVPA